LFGISKRGDRYLRTLMIHGARASLGKLGASRIPAKLKTDARNLVGIIGSDTTKTRTYCEILDLSAQLGREKDSKKAKALSQKIDQLQKQLGPEFLAVSSGLQHLDLNSPDGREIILIIGSLNQSCPD